MVNIIIIWGLIALFIIQPGEAHDGAVAGALLFVRALLPYLLPYIILTQWLLKISAQSNRKSQWGRFLKAYILGSFGGFPVGAVTVSEMAKNGVLSRKQSGWLLASCHAPGPMFVIGFIGTELFGDVGTGWKLLIAIHLANILFFLLTLIVLEPTANVHQPSRNSGKKEEGMPLLEAIKASSNVIILVATTVIFFSSLGTVLTNAIAAAVSVDIGITQTVTLSLFEMTTGVQSATEHFSDLAIFPILIAAIVSLNGLSIHMQVTVIAKSVGISLRPYILGRLWSILLTPAIFHFLL